MTQGKLSILDYVLKYLMISVVMICGSPFSYKKCIAYYTGIASNCAGVFHVYVTDCHGKVIRDKGLVNCAKQHIFDWYEAPSLYCVHLYPQLRPKDNRYKEVKDRDSCFELYGNEFSWSFHEKDSLLDCQH
ncbi:unnamed protein product [Rhizophagus irregularis]|nr:unnamed protein product [Rhizophagus irregularis]CAB4433774.1 unnamed protein product [Rhizophagus irregularis]